LRSSAARMSNPTVTPVKPVPKVGPKKG
jgi:hypothetical protein